MGKKTKSIVRSGRGSVMLIASLLLISAVLRLGVSATVVLAAEGGDIKLPVVTKPQSMEKERPDRAQLKGLLEAIQSREAKLSERERQADVREKALDVARTEIERRLVALEAAEKQLRSTLALTATAAEDDLARLTAVYENMKPKDAAALFEAMEPEFAAGFLGRMRPDAAANIMAGLTPQTAYTISVILAGRNAAAPKS